MTQNKNTPEELKLCMKLLPYSIKWKMQLIATGIFVAVAYLQFIMGAALGDGELSTFSLGGLYIAIAPMMFCQLLMIMTYAGMVQTSVYKHRLQCKLFALQYLAGILILHVSVVLFFLLLRVAGRGDTQLFARYIVPLLAATILMSWYYPVIYKLGKRFFMVMLLAMIFVVVFASQIVLITVSTRIIEMLFANVSFGMLAVLPVPVFFAVTFVIYKIACAMYRRPISEWYVNQSFKQAAR